MKSGAEAAARLDLLRASPGCRHRAAAGVEPASLHTGHPCPRACPTPTRTARRISMPRKLQPPPCGTPAAAPAARSAARRCSSSRKRPGPQPRSTTNGRVGSSNVAAQSTDPRGFWYSALSGLTCCRTRTLPICPGLNAAPAASARGRVKGTGAARMHACGAHACARPHPAGHGGQTPLFATHPSHDLQEAQLVEGRVLAIRRVRHHPALVQFGAALGGRGRRGAQQQRARRRVAAGGGERAAARGAAQAAAGWEKPQGLHACNQLPGVQHMMPGCSKFVH